MLWVHYLNFQSHGDIHSMLSVPLFSPSLSIFRALMFDLNVDYYVGFIIISSSWWSTKYDAPIKQILPYYRFLFRLLYVKNLCIFKTCVEIFNNLTLHILFSSSFPEKYKNRINFIQDDRANIIQNFCKTLI